PAPACRIEAACRRAWPCRRSGYHQLTLAFRGVWSQITTSPMGRYPRAGIEAARPSSGRVMEEFHKVRRLPPYVFEQVNRLKASARAGGADIIDLGMGNPDLPTPQAIVDKLCEVVQDPRTHRYSSSKGIPGLRRAQAAYYACRCGVKLNPETQ